MERKQHVVPRDTGWAVMPENGKRASRLLDTKDEAITYAKRVASNQDTDVVVHNKDGRISNVLTPRQGGWKQLTAQQAGINPPQHVVPHTRGWAVKSEGKQTPSVVDSKYKAVREAHKRADRTNAAMVVHNKDGSFQKVDNPPHFPSPMSALLHT